MSVKVGDSLNYKGAVFLVVSIEKRAAQGLASQSSDTMRSELTGLVNVRYLKGLDLGDFEEGDIINTVAEWCQLQRRDDNTVEYIYTKYEVHKEAQSGQNGQQEDANQAPDPQAKATDERT